MSYAAVPGRYPRLPHRRRGRRSLRLPEISPGLWQNSGDERPLDTQGGLRKV